MKQSRWLYIGLAAVFVLSIGVTLTLPVESAMRDLAATPALTALVGALFQLFREQAAFESQQFRQQQQETFSLGTTSHMASVAFDKHVEFCEQYMKEVHQTDATLFREGPTKKAFEHVGRFIDLKQQYAAWVPRDTALGLEPFEKALSEIAALSFLAAALRAEDGEGRSNAIDQMYDVFGSVMHLGPTAPVDGKSEVAVEVVKERVRAILGIEELTNIRQRLIQRALKSLEGNV